MPAAIVAMLVVVLFIVFWTRYKKIDMWEKTPIGDMAQSIRESSERLPEWDEAVEEWIEKQSSKNLS